MNTKKSCKKTKQTLKDLCNSRLNIISGLKHLDTNDSTYNTTYRFVKARLDEIESQILMQAPIGTILLT